jgi:hypothetical protein
MGQDYTMEMRWLKAKRVARQLLPSAVGEFVSPMADRGQFLALFNALVSSYLILQTASIADMVEEARSWILAAQAFGWTTLIWASISLIRAPFVIIKNERERGFWSGNRFVYKEPLLVQTIRCRPTGVVEMYKVRFDDAEPCSHVSYHLDLESGGHLAEVSIGSTILTNPIPYKNWPGTGSFMLSSDKTAVFLIKLPTNALAITARVFCRSFSIGDDIDGDLGNHKFKV